MATGLSPQVVTETVYALAVKGRPRWIPEEVHIYTTAEGAERARLSLLGQGQNWFGRMREEYGLPPIAFDEDRIHVLRDSGGNLLADIRTRKDNEAAADGLSAAVRHWTANTATEIHVSIAGGRKTMGFFAGYALSLYGRKQDRLSHVLVAANWENHPEFFYPTRQSRVIYTAPPHSRPLDTSKAEIELAEIPFVRLRDFWDSAEGALPGDGFGRAVDLIQEQVEDSRILSVDFTRRQVRVGETRIQMGAAEVAFLAMLLRRRVRGEPECECPGEGPDLGMGFAYLQEYRRLAGRDAQRTEKSLAGGMDRAFFLQRRSRYDAAMEATLGTAAKPYLIVTSGRRPCTRYGLGLHNKRVRLLGDYEASA